jgi:nickel/cobalt exporter
MRVGSKDILHIGDDVGGLQEPALLIARKHYRHPLSPRRIFAFLGLLLASVSSFAHPMGNFSVNHYSHITISRESVEIRYLIDMAEIPTYQELQESGIQASASGPSRDAFLRRKCEDFGRKIGVVLDGKTLVLKCEGREVIFPPGAGGLPTMKFGFLYHATLSKTLTQGSHHLHFLDENFSERTGWKEIVLTTEARLKLVGSSHRTDRSSELSNYPTDMLNSPPQDVEANIEFTVPADAGRASAISAAASNRVPIFSSGATQAGVTAQADASGASSATTPSSSIVANQQSTPRNAFTELITKQDAGFWFLITAAFIAMGLGALHALEPGHGKTLVAAYLVGSRGTSQHAVILGVIVTLAHTAGVYALGGITLYASRYVLPEKIFPWLGLVSGLTIAALGLYLFLQRSIGGASAGSPEDHRHWYDLFARAKKNEGSAVASSDEKASSAQSKPVSLRQLLLLGITGGMVPCPAALVVLLSAVALHRLRFGLFLIVAFSAGLAAVLIAIGLLMVRTGKVMERFDSKGLWLSRRLPLISAACIAILGCGLSIQAVISSGILSKISFSAGPRWILIAGFGLLLGMRHSTDPDHVIAVTTIVTRLRSFRHASMVGMLWGLGHTLTIFVVGSGIILFGIVIPPRLGLSMEFAVALMLILLGVLNLTGVLSWITGRYANVSAGAAAADPGFGKAASSLDSTISRMGTFQVVRPLMIGVVHGLAGSAAVALLVLATIRNPAWAIGYLLLFGLGTVVGMMLMTAVIAAPVVWSGKNFMRVNRYMYATSGVVSLAFGLFLVYQIGFVSGLFSSSPQWTPQ